MNKAELIWLVPVIVEAALRSLGVALLVGVGMWVLRIRQLPAERVAWVLVLAGAALMPLAMRAPLPVMEWAWQVPASGWTAKVTQSEPETQQTVAAQEVGGVFPAGAGKASMMDAARVAEPRALDAGKAQPVESGTVVASAGGGEATGVLASRGSGRPVMEAIAAVYLLVGLGLMVRWILSLVMSWGLWRRGVPVSLENGRQMRVRVSGEIASPVTIGRGILLPAGYERWAEEKLRIVLAHEQVHVAQGDFAVQALAALHAAVFWFSPLGWWLRRRLCELAEALSDCAGMAEATDAPAYAQVLLEFAALPRTTRMAGVPMANSSNGSGFARRIERILAEGGPRLSSNPRRAVLVASLMVATAVVATVAMVRVVPVVKAAGAGQSVGQVTSAEQVTSANGPEVQATPPAPAAAPMAAPAPLAAPEPDVAPLAAPAPDASSETEARKEAAEAHEFANDAKEIELEESAGHGYVFVKGGRDSELAVRGVPKEEVEKIRREHKGSYLYFEQNGKGYVIDDPALVAEGKSFFKGNPDFKLDQAKLQAEMAELQRQMAKIDMEQVRKQLESPEFKAEMDKLAKQLGTMEEQKAKELAERAAEMTAKMDKEIQEEKLGKLDEQIGDMDGKIGDIQGKIGDLNGKLGEEMGKMGAKQGELGEKMGKIGEQLGRLGMLDGQQAGEANERLRKLLDEAVKSGKAKPVD
jgi:hypothetical protein